MCHLINRFRRWRKKQLKMACVGVWYFFSVPWEVEKVSSGEDLDKIGVGDRIVIDDIYLIYQEHKINKELKINKDRNSFS